MRAGGMPMHTAMRHGPCPPLLTSAARLAADTAAQRRGLSPMQLALPHVGRGPAAGARRAKRAGRRPVGAPGWTERGHRGGGGRAPRRRHGRRSDGRQVVAVALAVDGRKRQRLSAGGAAGGNDKTDSGAWWVTQHEDTA